MTPETIEITPISRDKAVQLAAEGSLTQEEAGRIAGCSHQRISQLIRESKQNQDTIIFSQQKDKVFEALQAKIIDNVSDEDIKKANLQQKIWATGVIQDKIQTLRGQATEIIDYRSLNLTGTLSELREARERQTAGQKVINNDHDAQDADIVT